MPQKPLVRKTVCRAHMAREMLNAIDHGLSEHNAVLIAQGRCTLTADGITYRAIDDSLVHPGGHCDCPNLRNKSASPAVTRDASEARYAHSTVQTNDKEHMPHSPLAKSDLEKVVARHPELDARARDLVLSGKSALNHHGTDVYLSGSHCYSSKFPPVNFALGDPEDKEDDKERKRIADQRTESTRAAAERREKEGAREASLAPQGDPPGTVLAQSIFGSSYVPPKAKTRKVEGPNLGQKVNGAVFWDAKGSGSPLIEEASELLSPTITVPDCASQERYRACDSSSTPAWVNEGRPGAQVNTNAGTQTANAIFGDNN